MRNSIPLNLRLLAVALHLIGGSIATSIVVGVTILGLGLTSFSGAFYLIPLTIFLSPPLMLVLRIQTKNIHPFVDQAGRDAINCLLSTMVGMLFSIVFTIFIFSVTCGIGNQNPTPFFLSFIPFALVAIAYSLNSIASAILVAQGYRLNSRLIYIFIKNL